MICHIINLFHLRNSLPCGSISLMPQFLTNSKTFKFTPVDTARYHYHTISNPQVTNLLHLAKALVTKLGLNRRGTVKDRRQILMNNLTNSSNTQASITLSPSPETLEEWRALTGYFIISSVFVMSIYLGMITCSYSEQGCIWMSRIRITTIYPSYGSIL